MEVQNRNCGVLSELEGPLLYNIVVYKWVLVLQLLVKEKILHIYCRYRLVPDFKISLNKWQYILKCTSDAKCTLDVARHLRTPAEAGVRSFTGQACWTSSDASGRVTATPGKVAAVKSK